MKVKDFSYARPFCFLVFLFFALASNADESSGSSEHFSVAEELTALEADFAAMQENPIDWESAEGIRQDALLYRREDLTLQLLKSLVRVARRVLAMPADAAERGELAARLAIKDSKLEAAFTDRFDKLLGRINQKTLEATNVSGADRAILDAEIDSLSELRLRFLETIVDIVKIREALNFPRGALETMAGRALETYANERVGFIQLSSQMRKSISEKLKMSGKDPDLLAALSLQEHYIARATTRLDRTISQLDRLDMETASLRRVMIEQSKAISVSMVDADVLNILWEDLRDSLSVWLQFSAADFLFQALVFAAILLGARLLGRLARNLVQRGFSRNPGNTSQLLRDMTISLVGGGVFVIGFLIALSQIGISLAPMLAGLGVAGFIIGFALQDTLGNFAAGGMILIYRPFDVDDYIEVAGVDGTVKKMNLVSTTITTPDNQALIIPNSKIWGDVIRNKTGQRVRRVDLEFGISYSDSIEHAEEVFRKVLATMPAVLPEPAPNIQVIRHGESSIDFIVRPWVKTEDYWPTYWAMQRAVKLAFDEAGITIPFPQRDVHHFQGDNSLSGKGDVS
ncbi:MAG: mechanosensitive ion channel domain-containing protein [Luminiphilus sp.]